MLLVLNFYFICYVGFFLLLILYIVIIESIENDVNCWVICSLFLYVCSEFGCRECMFLLKMFVKFLLVFEDFREGNYIFVVNCEEIGILCYVGKCV